jgi:rare lipoprotein A
MNRLSVVLVIILVLLFAGCSRRGSGTYHHYRYSQAKNYSQDKSDYSSSVSSKNYKHPTMRPYVVRGIKYYPAVVSVGDRFNGTASWYGPKFHGKFTSNGERYNMYDMTAAHKTLPMNTIVKVTNKRNGKSTVVRVNDRGPFVANRIIDLSKSAAKKLEMVGTGTAPVTLEILGFQTKGKKFIPTKKELKKSPKNQPMVGGFALQIGSFSKISGAMITQERFDNTDGYKTIIKDVDDGINRSFKVWLTGFKTEQEARDYKALGKFMGAFIVRED